MADLIIHIGFPKCASTTLQNQVFKHTHGYLGTYQGLSKEENLAKQFKGVTPVGPRQWSNFSQAKKWTDRVRERYSSDIKRLILSDEMLSNKNKFQSTPIVSFLDKFSNDIWKSGQIKVIAVLRNYAERIASGYAQTSASNPNGGQADFERAASFQLKRNQLHDYSVWISSLHDCLGKDNVCVLLMEEIGTIDFWVKLKAFCDLPSFEPGSMMSSKKNSKRKNKNSWNLLPFNPERKANGMVNNLFGFAWPNFVFNQYRSKAFRSTKMELSKYYERKFPKANENRETYFELTEELRHKIQSHFSESTKNLSELLDKDMAALGY